ncbi:MAG TPA: prepilin-type N-terminal cleavage/methylation domain-containing protein [Planctomycetota bacterium]|nr:prepilin-type N-terminal cleavage/methylation domain-containing protein [Planctomycetota bacterium]
MKRRGFTLLELIVAISIFTIVISAAYALFDAGRSMTSRAEFRSQLFQTARTALQAVEDDLRGALMLGTAFDTGFIGTGGGSEKEPLDKLEFLSVNRHTGKNYDVNKITDVVWGSDVSKVYYWIEQDTKRDIHGFVRERPLELTPVNGPVRRDESVSEVAQDVVYLHFRYFDGTDWLPTWDSTQTRKLPKAVEVTVYVRGELNNEEVFEPFMSRFYLPVGAETPEKAAQ